MNFNEYFEKANDVWNFKHKALTAAYKMFGLFINFNYATSEIEFVDNENAFIIGKTPKVQCILYNYNLYLHIKIIEYGTTFSGAIKTQNFG